MCPKHVVPFFSWDNFKKVGRLREPVSTTETERYSDESLPSQRPIFSLENFKRVDRLRELIVQRRRVEHELASFPDPMAFGMTVTSSRTPDVEAARQSISVAAQREMLSTIANTTFEKGPVSSDSNPKVENYTTEVQCNPDPPLAASQSQDSRLIESRGHDVKLPENSDSNRGPVQQTVDEADNDYQVEVPELPSEPPLEQGIVRDADSHTDLPPSPHAKQPSTDLPHSKDVDVGDKAVASPDPTRHELTKIPKTPSGDQIDQELEGTMLERDNQRSSLEKQEHPKSLQEIATSEGSSPETKEISSVSKVPEPQSSRWAILIGIDFYPERDQRNEGRVADVRLFKEALEPHGPIQVREFTASNDVEDENQSAPLEDSSQWPTRENIISTLEDFANQAKEGDHVIFFYTGLSFVRNRSIERHSNKDGIDVAPILIKPQDGGIEEDVMPGGELNQNATRQTTSKIYPGAKIIYRSPLEEDIISKGVINDPHEPRVTDDYLLKPYGYTLLATYGSYELADTTSCDHQYKHGLFSCALIKALESNKWPESAGNLQLVYAKVCQRLGKSKLAYQSHTVLLGELSHTFFGARNPKDTPIPRFNVIKRGIGDDVWLNAGKMHGISVEDRYQTRLDSFLEDGTIEKMHGIGLVIIEETYGLSSRAKISTSRSLSKITLGWYASLLYHGRTKARVKISPNLDSKFSEKIRKSHWLAVIDKPDGPNDADFLEVTQDTGDRTTIKSRNQSVAYVSSPPRTKHEPTPQEEVISALEHLAMFSSFEALTNQSNYALTDKDFTVQVLHDGENKGPNHVRIYDGQKINLFLQNNTEFPLYYLVYGMELLGGTISVRNDRLKLPSSPTTSQTWWSEVPKNSPSIPNKRSTFIMYIPEEVIEKGYTQGEITLKIFIATEPVQLPTRVLPSLWDGASGNAFRKNFLFFLDRAIWQDDGLSFTEKRVRRVKWMTKSFHVEIEVP